MDFNFRTMDSKCTPVLKKGSIGRGRKGMSEKSFYMYYFSPSGREGVSHKTSAQSSGNVSDHVHHGWQKPSDTPHYPDGPDVPCDTVSSRFFGGGAIRFSYSKKKKIKLASLTKRPHSRQILSPRFVC